MTIEDYMFEMFCLALVRHILETKEAEAQQKSEV